MLIIKAIFKAFSAIFSLVFSAATAFLLTALLVYGVIGKNLPKLAELNEVKLSVPLKIFTADGKLIANYGEQRRRPVSYEQLPPHLVQAFLAAEDDRFFEHPGVDWQGLARAVMQLASTGEKAQGGSTITMQLTRNLVLSNEKSYERKLKEILLSLRMERDTSKEEILTLYLNKIFLGHRAYGVGAAADVYYGKRLDELTLAEMATIASLPKAPSTGNPLSNPKKALDRRSYVLRRMHELNLITDEERDIAAAAPITAKKQPVITDLDAGYIAEMARADVVARFGEDAYETGYRVFTSIRAADQQAANNAVRSGLRAYDLRHGYRGPEATLQLPANDGIAGDNVVPAWEGVLREYPAIADLQAGLVIDVQHSSARVYLEGGRTISLDSSAYGWARPYIDENKQGSKPNSASDVMTVGNIVRVRNDGSKGWQLSQRPSAQAAFVALDPRTGAIRALVGGYEFQDSKFNRAVQSIRQPGSGFKPFLYSAALEKGFTAASIINDAPVVFESAALETTWRPQNYSGRTFGPTRLREALVKSRNLVSIRILQAIGINYTRDYAERFGFEKKRLARDLSLSLGNAAITPLQMSAAFSVFANGGFRVEPYFIDRIESFDGTLLYEVGEIVFCETCPTPEPAPKPAKEPETKKPADKSGKQALADGDSKTAEEAPYQAKPRYAPRVISTENAWIISSIMRDVVKRGTGKKAMALGRNDISGKTGTTNDQLDAWFNGFNSKLVGSAWVGFDSAKPMGRREFGSAAALPIWLEYMQTAMQGIPEDQNLQPPGIVSVRIDSATGLRANANTAKAVFESFRSGNTPERSPEVVGGTPGASSGSGDDGDSDGFGDLLF